MKIDCERIATAMLEEAKQRFEAMRKPESPCNRDNFPSLSIIKVGNDPASEVYVRNKVRVCADLGVESMVYHLPADCDQQTLELTIERIVDDFSPHGIILQLPLPGHLNADDAAMYIPLNMDVDGLHDNSGVTPCTPRGIMAILDGEGVELSGKHAVIIGRSKLVGKPLAKLLLERDCTVTVCHSKTADLAEITRTADILISAVGKPGLIELGMVKPGAIIIDVGISRVDGKLVGDADPWFSDPHCEVYRCTPVPGGVGKTTVAALMLNLAELAGTRK